MKIVITTTHLAHFAGSEIVALEIAEHFSAKKDNQVFLITNYYDNPIKAMVETDIYKTQYPNLIITTDWNIEINYEEMDLVWVQHQLVPSKLMRMFIGKPITKPFIIFHHLGQLDLRYFHGQAELALADKICSISQENIESLRGFLADREIELFPNPAPLIFTTFSRRVTSQSLKRVALISNHPPSECVELKNELKANGIEMVVYGVNANYQRITPNILSQFDTVITIGKTVQYCLVMGIPVYVYDHFGGFGYLNDGNYSTASFFNFSGRGGEYKNTKTIANELVENFESACIYSNTIRGHSSEIYNLDSCLRNVMKAKLRAKHIDENNVKQALYKLDVMRDSYKQAAYINLKDEQISLLATENGQLKEALAKVNSSYRQIHRLSGVGNLPVITKLLTRILKSFKLRK